MKLSTPVYRLKRKAKILSREQSLPLHEALDRVASQEGFARWSLLAAHESNRSPAKKLLPTLEPGDMLLLGARPGHGKTLLGLELVIEAMKSGRHGAFFTLAYSTSEVLQLFDRLGQNPASFDQRFALDVSDSISADHIMQRLSDMPRGTIVAIDYLQLLDQKRANPDLMQQVRKLKRFAGERELIMLFISQISRAFDQSAREHPGLEDIRLPNPLDLMLFSKACFLNNGELRLSVPG